MSTEYGIFNDEGCVERGFWSAEEALRELKLMDPEDHGDVKELCPEHEEQARDTCEECFAEDEGEEDEDPDLS